MGLRVRGTGEGRKVKGHKWERRMPAKLEARRKAMEGMPELIRLWKQVRSTVVLQWKDFLCTNKINRWVTERDGRNIRDSPHFVRRPLYIFMVFMPHLSSFG